MSAPPRRASPPDQPCFLTLSSLIVLSSHGRSGSPPAAARLPGVHLPTTKYPKRGKHGWSAGFSLCLKSRHDRTTNQQHQTAPTRGRSVNQADNRVEAKKAAKNGEPKNQFLPNGKIRIRQFRKFDNRKIAIPTAISPATAHRSKSEAPYNGCRPQGTPAWLKSSPERAQRSENGTLKYC